MSGQASAIVASALVLGFCSRVEWPWMLLVWVGLVPWLVVLDRAQSIRASFFAGLAMCLAFSLSVFGWFADAIAGYADTSRALAWLLLALGAPAFQSQFLTFALARRVLRRDLGIVLGTVGAALVYVGTEWAWPKLFADTLGHGLYASAWLRQGADLGGAEGLTLVVLLVNECVCFAATHYAGEHRRVFRAIACAAGMVLALALYGHARLDELAKSNAGGTRRAVTAGLVQASITGYEDLRRARGTFGAVEWIVDEHIALTRDAIRDGVDFVVWPETVYPTTFGHAKSEEGQAFDAEITGLVATSRVPLVFGSYDADEENEYNAAFFVTPTTEGGVHTSVYRKAHLFPLTESVPRWLDTLGVRRALPWLGTWRPGQGPRVIDLALSDGRTLRVVPMICLDAVVAEHALGGVVDGGELILALSNDSWFAETAGARLHLVVSAFRSIETRRPQLRVTNSGISAAIGADGEIVTSTQVGERRALVATVVPTRGTTTLMLLWGDWFGRAALGTSAGLLFVAKLRRRRGQI